MQFCMLGPLDVRDAHGVSVQVGGQRQRAALAALLWHHDSGLSAPRLVEVVWGAEPPHDPRAALQTCVSRLRRALPEGTALLHSAGTYRLDLGEAQLDLVRFRELVKHAARRRAAGDVKGAASDLRSALALWQGEAFADLDDVPALHAARVRLDEERMHALEERIEADLDAGAHQAVVGELRELLDQHPLRERLYALLMLALYRSGRQLEALEVFRSARTMLIDHFGVEPGASLQALHDGILCHDTTLTGSVPVPLPAHNLPYAVSSLVGREQVLADLRRLLSGARLVTLTGPGGVGKTRLAVECGRDSLEAYPHGVHLVELGSLSAGEHVARQVADALELVLEAGRPVVAPLVEHCRHRVMLLILDNSEHLLDATADLVLTLQRHCPRVTVLVTSREPLACDGEHVLPVPPLDVPRDARSDSEHTAVELFRQRATAADPAFRLDAGNAEAVRQICAGLEGLPLAIELAAAWVPALSCAQIADRLRSSFALLEQVRRSSDPRHRSLRAALDWSYDLLAEPEQALLRHVSVFVTGFRLEDAQAVLSSRADQDVLAGLSRLRAGSLVTGQPVEGRYRLLEPVRQYALAQLEKQGELHAARQAHARSRRDLAVRAEPELRNEPPRVPAVIVELEQQHDDFRAGLEWSISTGCADIALETAGHLWIFWWSAGHMVEGITWLTRALAVPGGSPAPAARASTGLAFLASQDFRWDSARDHVGDALRWFHQVPETLRSAHHAYALFVRAEVLTHDEAFDAAHRAVDEGLEIVAEVGDGWGYAFGTWARANLAFVQGDLDGAHAGHTRMLEVMRSVGLPVAMVAALHSLGVLELTRERHDEARRYLQEALELRRKTGADRLGRYHGSTGSELRDLARAALGQGDVRSARSYAEEGLAIAAVHRDDEVATGCRSVLARLGAD